MNAPVGTIDTVDIDVGTTAPPIGHLARIGDKTALCGADLGDDNAPAGEAVPCDPCAVCSSLAGLSE